MATFLETKSIGYDDVVLIAQPGVVRSRKQIPIEGKRIVVSAMTSIIGPEFIKAVAKLPKEYQPTLHIPRDIYAEENLELAHSLKLKNIFVGVGLNTPKLEELAKKFEFNTVLLDVANGYLLPVKEKVFDLKNKGFHVVVGSVHTGKGALDLVLCGADVVRSGIGPGSVCITSATAGYTRHPITDILALSSAKVSYLNFQVLADGGLANVSDVSKAFLCGADYIMSGRLFVNAEEARLRVDGTDIYYGMASAMGKKAMGKEIKHVEGKYQKLSRENLRPLKEIIEDIWDGLRSAVSYSGYSTLTEAIGNGVFEIKQSK
jgi:IMP dehydrogenase/GMP reductase